MGKIFRYIFHVTVIIMFMKIKSGEIGSHNFYKRATEILLNIFK